MRIGNLSGRAVLLTDSGAVDIERSSGGRFAADPQQLYETWDELTDWARAGSEGDAEPAEPARLGSPAPRPRQVFAIGLNYREHAAEAGVALPEHPTVFTKFPSAITGPYGEIGLPSGSVDWEVELVVVIGRRAERVAAEHGWEHVAGLTAGQDLSERVVQYQGPVPQFSMGKSFPGFAPMGPSLVTPDELDTPDDLELSCSVDDEVLQRGRTGDLVFPVPELVSRLSAITPLLPGDVIFTGTPPGVGHVRTPKRFLQPGTELVTTIERIGTMRHRLVGAV